MIRTIAILSVFLCSFSAAFSQSEIDSLLKVLDSAMAKSKSYMQAKDMRLKSLRLLLNQPGQTPDQIYTVNSLLYREYLKYNFDSSLNYIHKNLKLARAVNNPDWINEASFELSRIFSSSGMYFESMDILNSLDRKRFTGEQKRRYYSCLHQLYAELGLYSALPDKAREYTVLSNAYRDTLLSILDPQSADALLLKAAELQDKGDFEKSREINAGLIAGTEQGSPEFALYAFLRAISYRIQGNVEMQEKYLILSAISDIKNAVKDNVSLTLLAVLLYDQDEIDLSYKYIMYSLEDAKFFNSKLRYVEISRILPLISESFRLKNERQQQKLRYYALITTILAIMLIVGSLFLYYQMKRLSRARVSLQAANNRMNNLHQDLIKVNVQLKALNHELLESNRTKEEHIGFFLNLCSTYIDKLEEFRKFVHRKVTSGQYEDLFKATKSNHFFDSELKDFYNNFDNTFLHLFPDFVEQFNALLMPNEQIVIKTDELLTTELRIFALIRLGITDSSKIASFLRYSVNTIYNYRTRIRNKALLPRDDFERRVRLIGLSVDA